MSISRSVSDKRVLITGARAPVTLHLARLLNETGYTVFAADSVPCTITSWSGHVMGFFRIFAPAIDASVFIKELIHIIIKERIDILLPTCEEIFHIGMHLEELNRYCFVLCEDISLLRALHSKWEFSRLARMIGLPFPETVLFVDEDECMQAVDQAARPFVLKPEYSRFGTSVFIGQPGGLRPNVHPTKRHPWVMQDFIEGSQICTYSICKDGQVLVHAMYRSKYALGAGATIYFKSIEHSDIESAVKKLVRHLNFTGQIAFDIIESPEAEFYFIECNPRATSGIHLFTKQDCIFENVFDPCSDLPIKTIYPYSENVTMVAFAMLQWHQLRKEALDGGWREWWRDFRQARDVVFQWRDPKPAIVQFFYLLFLYIQAKKFGCTLPEVSTKDIEWNG